MMASVLRNSGSQSSPRSQSARKPEFRPQIWQKFIVAVTFSGFKKLHFYCDSDLKIRLFQPGKWKTEIKFVLIN